VIDNKAEPVEPVWIAMVAGQRVDSMVGKAIGVNAGLLSRECSYHGAEWSGRDVNVPLCWENAPPVRVAVLLIDSPRIYTLT
jgi:hypothetical protein